MPLPLHILSTGLHFFPAYLRAHLSGEFMGNVVKRFGEPGKNVAWDRYLNLSALDREIRA